MTRSFENAVYEACLTPPVLLRENPPEAIKRRLDFLTEILDRNQLANDIDWLLVVGLEADQKFKLKSPFSIGRSKRNDLVVGAVYASRNHCVLELNGEHWMLRDLNSSHGVYVNGHRVAQIFLKHGDLIKIDTVSIFFLPKTEAF